jgi:hypothetical protein
LPNAPEPRDDLGTDFGTCVLSRARLVGGILDTLILDMTRGDWVRVPSLWRDRDWRRGPVYVNTRRKLILFGGARWNRAHPTGSC